MAFEPGQRGQFASQINVTPLVDVMLVLLVIFMVTAPMIQQGVEVSVPRVKASALPGKEEQFVVSITRNQEVYLNDTKLGLDQLTEKLQAIAHRAARPRSLRACRRASALRHGDQDDGGDQGGGDRKRRDGDRDAAGGRGRGGGRIARWQRQTLMAATAPRVWATPERSSCRRWAMRCSSPWSW